MDHTTISKFWNDAWTEGLWAAAWGKALKDLSAQQAAWRPAPGRHSIWQVVNHMLFWRTNELNLQAGKPKATDQEIDRGNWLEPAQATDAAWKQTVARFEETQKQLGAILADPKRDISRSAYMLPHDCYHFGQVMLLRALQGLPSLE